MPGLPCAFLQVLQGNLCRQCLGIQLHLAPGRAPLVSCFPAPHRLQVLGSLRAGIKQINCSDRALEFEDGFVSAEKEDSALVYICPGANLGCCPRVFLTLDGKTALTKAKLSSDKFWCTQRTGAGHRQRLIYLPSLVSVKGKSC